MPISTFGLEPGDDIIHTLVIPKNVEETTTSTGSMQIISIFHPTALPLDPIWIAQLEDWNAELIITDTFTQYSIPNSPPPITPQNPANTQFDNQLQFLGTDNIAGELVTYWQVVAPITQPMRLFIHVLDENGEIIAEDYSWDSADPQNLWQPHWQEGDLIFQKHQLPQGLNDASQIRIGIFDPYSCDPDPCQNHITDKGTPFLLLPVTK